LTQSFRPGKGTLEPTTFTGAQYDMIDMVEELSTPTDEDTETASIASSYNGSEDGYHSTLVKCNARQSCQSTERLAPRLSSRASCRTPSSLPRASPQNTFELWEMPLELRDEVAEDLPGCEEERDQRGRSHREEQDYGAGADGQTRERVSACSLHGNRLGVNVRREVVVADCLIGMDILALHALESITVTLLILIKPTSSTSLVLEVGGLFTRYRKVRSIHTMVGWGSNAREKISSALSNSAPLICARSTTGTQLKDELRGLLRNKG
jgi:hypothetical protein